MVFLPQVLSQIISNSCNTSRLSFTPTHVRTFLCKLQDTDASVFLFVLVFLFSLSSFFFLFEGRGVM